MLSFALSCVYLKRFLQIVFEALIGLVVGIFGASLYVNESTPLKEITWAGEMKRRCILLLYLFAIQRSIFTLVCMNRSIDEMDSRLGFANFANRGRTIFSSLKSRESIKS